MGSSLLLWVFPIQEHMEGQGLYYPEVPQFSVADLDIIEKKTQKKHSKDVNDSYTVDQFGSEVMDLILKAERRTQGQKFIINGELIELSKK